jgi:hypothetical protein
VKQHLGSKPCFRVAEFTESKKTRRRFSLLTRSCANASIVADLIATDEKMIAPEFIAPRRAELLEALRRKSQAVEVELVRSSAVP